MTHDHAHRSVHEHGHAHPAPVGPETLRARGRRVTRQRELIWAALIAEPDAHLSADAIATSVREQLPRVNASTIYRSLDVLVEEGLVLRTQLGAERTFYEPAHDHLHHHIVCRGCAAVTHVHDHVFIDLPARIEATSGYALGREEITLFGLCPTCRAGRSDEPPLSQLGSRRS